MRLHVAGIQFPVTKDVASNVAHIRRAIDQASDCGARMLVTPEGALSGYHPHFDRGEVEAALTQVTDHAARHAVGLMLGTCWEEDDGKRYNQVRVYDPSGAYLGYHSKILLCGNTVEGRLVGECTLYATTPLRTFTIDGITVGALVCNDLWANPQCTSMPDMHLTAQLSDMGAKVIFHAVHGGRSDTDWSRMVRTYHETNLRMRARAAGVWIVTADSAEPAALHTAAPSGVISPDGEWVVRATERGADFFHHCIDLQ